MTATEPKFDLILFGNEAKGEELEKIAEKLAALLKISRERAKQLLETPVGKTVAKAVTLETAGPVKDMLLVIGVKAEIKPTKPSSKLELIEIEKTKLSCPACGHQYTFQDPSSPPTNCEDCGVVFAKYEKVLKEKEEKERLHNLLLAEHQSKMEADRIKREAMETERRRKLFAEEMRKKMGIPSIINSKERLISSAIAIHIIGIALGIGSVILFDIIFKPMQVIKVENQNTATNSQNPGIMAQMLVNKMLSGFNNATTTASIPTETNVVSTSNKEPSTSLQFLDAKLAELKTNAEWDQHLLIQIDSLLTNGDAANASLLLNKLNRVKLRFNRGGRLIGQLWNLNQHEIANKLYHELTIAGERLTGGPLARIEALCIIGHHLSIAGRIGEANEILKKTITFESAIIEPMDRAIANSEVAALMTALGREEDARFLFSSAINALEVVADHKQQLLGIAQIAPSYAKAGYRISALNLIENAIRKVTVIADDKARINVLEKLAKVSSELSDAQMALTAVQRISDVNIRDKAIYYIIVEEALADRLAQATDLVAQLKTPIYQALTYGFLALNQKRQVVYQRLADSSFAQAKKAAETIAVNSEKAVIMSELGRFTARSGDISSANAYFAESIQLTQALTVIPERDRVLAIMAINKAHIAQFNAAQADLVGISDNNLRRIVTSDIKIWQ